SIAFIALLPRSSHAWDADNGQAYTRPQASHRHHTHPLAPHKLVTNANGEPLDRHRMRWPMAWPLPRVASAPKHSQQGSFRDGSARMVIAVRAPTIVTGW